MCSRRLQDVFIKTNVCWEGRKQIETIKGHRKQMVESNTLIEEFIMILKKKKETIIKEK